MLTTAGELQLQQYSKADKLRHEDPYQELMEICLCLQIGGLSFSVTASDVKNLAIERQAEIKCLIAGPFGRLMDSWLPSSDFHLLNVSQISASLVAGS